MTGTISFGYTPPEIAALGLQFPGKRLAPVVPTGAFPTLSLSVAIPAPHKFALRVTPSIPFPDVMFNCTLRMDAPGTDVLAAEIQNRWAAKTLLSGATKFSFDMRDAIGGYDAVIDYRACVRWLNQQPNASSGITLAKATALITQYVMVSDAALLSSIGIADEPAQRENARQRLVEVLLSGVMFEQGAIITFDVGEKLRKYLIQPENVLAPPSRRVYVHTDPVTETIGYQFP